MLQKIHKKFTTSSAGNGDSSVSEKLKEASDKAQAAIDKAQAVLDAAEKMKKDREIRAHKELMKKLEKEQQQKPKSFCCGGKCCR